MKRGLGTIREDLNISVPDGARVEIKGAQDLSLLPTYVRNEMERQRSLIEIRRILKERGAVPVDGVARDISVLLKDSRSKVIHSALSKGGKVFCSALPLFAGVMRSPDSKLRLGAEMAQHARARGVAGIFHSDELPAYGITAEEVAAIRSELSSPGRRCFRPLRGRRRPGGTGPAGSGRPGQPGPGGRSGGDP